MSTLPGEKQFQRDLQAGLRGAALPGGLSLKLPNADRELAWQYVFPASRIYTEEKTGIRRRHHYHESAVQRAVATAVRASRIHKRASCHSLRHSFATHLLRGACYSPPVTCIVFSLQGFRSPKSEGTDLQLHNSSICSDLSN